MWQPCMGKKSVYHHSITRAEDGSYWIWRGEGLAASQHQVMENFNPDTDETIREFTLLDDVINGTSMPLIIFSVRPEFKFS